MERHLFNKIITDVCNRDSYFVQKKDACGVMGLLPEQKITAALRMLAHGASTDQVDEITRMGKSTILEALMRFCGAVESLYIAEYLRQPTHMDLQRLLKKGEMRVASFDTWIWHAFFGVPGAQNDLNVLTQSPVFNDVLQGKAPKVTYVVNRRRYDGPYYLADDIYPRIIMERFFKRKSSSGSGSSNNVDSSNTVGSSRTPSSRQSQLDDVLGNLQADPGLRT
ncbi:uncharacterized protein [Malus domestica]|uniref:uncharacterized protein n=1 Tax=Malus domestica TaxID=3750 RepID=UPI003974C809